MQGEESRGPRIKEVRLNTHSRGLIDDAIGERSRGEERSRGGER